MRETASPTPDKLTLSKRRVSSKADEAKIAKEREAKDAAAREAELAKKQERTGISKAAANALPSEACGTSSPAVTVPVAAVPGSI